MHGLTHSLGLVEWLRDRVEDPLVLVEQQMQHGEGTREGHRWL